MMHGYTNIKFAQIFLQPQYIAHTEHKHTNQGVKHSLTHTKDMISNMLGMKTKCQGHLQYKLPFDCLVGVLRGPKMKNQHYLLLLYWYE
jgi:hypothetical protein